MANDIIISFCLGLLLEINVEQNEYASDLTKDAGIRVQIENPGKVPFPYEKGFSVGPGSATSVGIRKVIEILENNLLKFIILYCKIFPHCIPVNFGNLFTENLS